MQIFGQKKMTKYVVKHKKESQKTPFFLGNVLASD